MLTEEHKQKRIEAGRMFLERHDEQGVEFLDSVVTGDEIWISYTTPETKRIDAVVPYTFSQRQKIPNNSLKPESHGIHFWDRKRVILVDYMVCRTTINAQVYCETLKKLRSAIKNKRRGTLTKGVCLLHDNAHPHTARAIQELLQQFG
jgi:hypothetical protein